MRKILSQEEMERKKKRRNSILSVVMLLVLVGGTAGYAFSFSDNSNQDSGTNNGNSNAGDYNYASYNTLTIEGQDLNFVNKPEEVKNIGVEISRKIGEYSGKPLYISSNNEEVTREVATTLGKFASRVQRACYGECAEDLPVKTCEDNLIVIDIGKEAGVSEEKNCVFVNGGISSADAFLYKVFGIN